MPTIFEGALKQADDVLDAYWDGKTLPVPVIAMTNGLGVKTYTADMVLVSGKGAIPRSSISGHTDGATIYVDEAEDGMKRYLFAYELGYYVLYTVIKDWPKFGHANYTMPNGRITDHYEAFADRFAMALTMPEAYMQRCELDRDINMYDMAKSLKMPLTLLIKWRATLIEHGMLVQYDSGRLA